MAALHERRARLLATLYATFGEPATWTPADGGAAIPVTVRRKGEDQPVGYGDNEALAWKDFLRVRASEVPSPREGDLVTVTETGEKLRILGEPRRVKDGLEFVCEPGPVREF